MSSVRKKRAQQLVRRITTAAIETNTPITLNQVVDFVEKELDRYVDVYKTREALLFRVKNTLIVLDWQIPKDPNEPLYRSRY